MKYSLLIVLFVAVSLLLSTLAIDAEAYQKGGKRYGQDELEKPRIQLNKYYNYVHFQPEWNSYPRNILFDITNQWIRDNSKKIDFENESKKNYQKPHQGAQQRTNQLQYIDGKSYVEVKYDYIDCSYQWIHYAKYGTDIIRSHFDYLAGIRTDADNFTSFTKIPGSDNEQSFASKLEKPYSQFIPICTSKEHTSIDYGVRIDDKELGFDVYLVPSINERYNFHYNKSAFVHYEDTGCSAKNYQSYSGTCNVNKDGGLLIVIPDEFQRSLTKVTIKIKENVSN